MIWAPEVGIRESVRIGQMACIAAAEQGDQPRIESLPASWEPGPRGPLHSAPLPMANTVFLAEDDEAMRQAVAATLRGAEYHVREACDGAELLDMLLDAVHDPLLRPRVVVADVRMPNLSGLGVLAALRRAAWNIPVLLITALTDPSVQTLARRLGAIGVLRKPFDTDDLLTAVLNAGAVGHRA